MNGQHDEVGHHAQLAPHGAPEAEPPCPSNLNEAVDGMGHAEQAPPQQACPVVVAHELMKL
eukprot:9490544-Lingulodinium_polyedra.AAC.1